MASSARGAATEHQLSNPPRGAILKTARRLLRDVTLALTVILTLTLALVVTPRPAFAQDGTEVFAPAVSLNRTYVSQIETASTAADLGTLQADANVALGTGRTLVNLLETVQATTENDAIRSRAEGLLRHVEAAQDALERSLTRTGLSEALADLDAARGEAVEALSEVQPFEAAPAAAATTAPVAVATTAPAELPVTGSPSPLLLIPLVAIGLVLLALGSRLRRN